MTFASMQALVQEQFRVFVARFSKPGLHCDRFGKPAYDLVLGQVLSDEGEPPAGVSTLAARGVERLGGERI